MMAASGPTNPAVGYHRWHAIIRAQIELGLDAARRTEIDRHLGLAWAIQSEAQPVQGDEPNPGFDRFPYPAGAVVPEA